MKATKRGRGRPRVFTGARAKAIVGVIRRHGLAGAQRALAAGDYQLLPGRGREAVAISLPTLGKLAHEARVKLKKGRPALAA